MNASAPHTIGTKLTAALDAYPRLTLAFCDEGLYRRFRVLEQSLVSCLDQQVPHLDTDLRFLAVYLDGRPAGVASLIVQRNKQKKTVCNAYGRIDLVIVAHPYRGLGLGKVLMFAALVHLLEAFEQRLYSISCLAAHPAVETILTQAGFDRRDRQGKGFVHQELRTDGLDVRKLVNDFVTATAQAARTASFRCRQRQVAVAPGGPS